MPELAFMKDTYSVRHMQVGSQLKTGAGGSVESQYSRSGTSSWNWGHCKHTTLSVDVVHQLASLDTE